MVIIIKSIIYIIKTFIFAFLYWIQDVLLTKYPKFSTELYLGKSSPPAVSFQYYLWYSLITQTTVGYGGMLLANGDSVPYQKITEVPLKVLNSLLSVISLPLMSITNSIETKLGKKKSNLSVEKLSQALELTSNEVALHGDGVYIGKQQVGVVTSATRSPILKKNIALCRITVSESEIGNDVEIGKLDGHQKRLSAKIVRFPFYDPEKTRVRM